MQYQVVNKNEAYWETGIKSYIYIYMYVIVCVYVCIYSFYKTRILKLKSQNYYYELLNSKNSFQKATPFEF